MQPKLTENPRDWLKFTAAVCILIVLSIAGLSRRGVIQHGLAWILIGFVLAVLGICAIKPAWFRLFYRAGMTITFFIGQGMSRVLLVVIFLILVVPLGLILRLLGKDLLRLKRNRSSETYWQPAKPTDLHQQF